MNIKHYLMAGAILSIAFNKPWPIVDGNVRRVLSRVYGWTGEGRFPCGSGFLREIPHQCRIPPATNRRSRPRTCSPVNAPERNRAARSWASR